ncbi:MAG: EAL domain-containing protein [Alphaproteobacteria bacterium]|jgi:EAL domain-containing protein (putative c-di-GMP-specific phosphodiesterase class I)/CHASE2 domain-containing sensor protein|nr:MAG: EAL domain-containing protein [Alphaproteobacteria bacterium]
MQASAWISNHWRVFALALCCLVGVLAGLSGIGVGAERVLRGLAWQVRQQPASGNIHIIEIDARSIAAINHWPWPRSNYAMLIDNLSRAGVSSIAFDVDFSAKSNALDDTAFAASLSRTGGEVVLPTFRQPAGGGRVGWTDSLPIPALRQHSTLAAVTILPDRDGYIRRVPIGVVTKGVPRPSLSASIAGVGGSAGKDFPIDYSIDPDTIPRHSFIDIRDGRFDPARLAGKQVLIGATAIEMGDRYTVPRYGVIPGVVIQALAAETLANGTPREAGWQLPLFLASLLAWLILRATRRSSLALAAAGSPLLLLSAFLAADAVLNRIFPLIPAMAVVAAAIVVAAMIRALRAAKRRRAHDPDTGLPNRFALREAMRSYGGAGVVAARLTEFDKLAASLGADGTVELMRRLRDRLAMVSEGNTVYRVEDRVLAWRCYDRSQLESRLDTFRTLMLSPIEAGGRRVDVALAIGFAAEVPGVRPDQAIAHAALAADRALSEGRSWHVHDAADEDATDRDVSLLGELDEAIDNGEIQVVYQPKLDLKTDRITSVEALVRWHHRTRGFLPPDLFIPLAERGARIDKLTMFVMKRTIADLLKWHHLGLPVSGAVNISAKLLGSPSFTAGLTSLVRESGISPELLTFEVTESAAMTDPRAATNALHAFRELGVSISMDDYGTGQSTLSYLKQLPLNELKIDRSFVQFAHQNRGDGVLVRSTIDLAHELGLKVVAEGVEDGDCLTFLRTCGCDLVQGYFISRPVAADAIGTMLANVSAEAS